MFQLSLRRADHVRHYSIRAANPFGWEVKLEEDRELRRKDLYEDWHRVERARMAFALEAATLAERGWNEA